MEITERCANGIVIFELTIPPSKYEPNNNPLRVSIGHSAVGHCVVQTKVVLSHDEPRTDLGPEYLFLNPKDSGVTKAAVPEHTGLPAFFMEPDADAIHKVLVPQMIEKGIITTFPQSLKLGKNVYPAASVNLTEREVCHQCSGCKKWEGMDTKSRYMRCERCRTAYYCGKECQTKDWAPSHKEECRLYSSRNYTALEKLLQDRRAAWKEQLRGMGFNTFIGL